MEGKKALSGAILEILGKLAKQESLFDTADIYARFASENIVGGICTVAALMVFLATAVAVLIVFLRNNMNFRIGDYYALFIKSFMILIMFCVLYPEICKILVKISSVLNISIGSETLKSFSVEMRKFMYTIQTPSAAENIVAGVVRGVVNWVSRYILGGFIIEGLLALTMWLLIVMVHIYMSVGPFCFIMALLLGPVCMALSIIMPGIARNWANFLFGSLYFPLVCVIVFMTIVDTNLLAMASSGLYFTHLITSLLSLMVIMAFMVMAPFVVTQIFGVSAFGFLGRILGWAYGLTIYLLPVSLMTEALHLFIASDIASPMSEKLKFDRLMGKIGSLGGKSGGGGSGSSGGSSGSSGSGGSSGGGSSGGSSGGGSSGGSSSGGSSGGGSSGGSSSGGSSGGGK